MPKLRKSQGQQDLDARNEFQKEISRRRFELDLAQHDIAVELDLADSTVSDMIHNLDTISGLRLRKLIRFLVPNPMVVLRWAGYTDRQINDWISSLQ